MNHAYYNNYIIVIGQWCHFSLFSVDPLNWSVGLVEQWKAVIYTTTGSKLLDKDWPTDYWILCKYSGRSHWEIVWTIHFVIYNVLEWFLCHFVKLNHNTLSATLQPVENSVTLESNMEAKIGLIIFRNIIQPCIS